MIKGCKATLVLAWFLPVKVCIAYIVDGTK